jgi:hypothetical protein
MTVLGFFTLPAGLSGPLHILEPEGFSPWWWLLGAILLYLLWRRLRRWWREVPSRTPRASTRPGRGKAGPAHGLTRSIERLRTVTHATGQYRAGFHALAQTLRESIEAGRLGRAVPGGRCLTARELAEPLGDTALSRFLHLLADFQFDRREPDGDDFDGACDLAVDIARGKEGRS